MNRKAHTITTDDIDAVLSRAKKARTGARELCRQYAKQETEWRQGDRVKCLLRGATFQVRGFAGVHPVTWTTGPIVRCSNVRANGTVGARDKYIEIDTRGGWRRKWKRLGSLPSATPR